MLATTLAWQAARGPVRVEHDMQKDTRCMWQFPWRKSSLLQDRLACMTKDLYLVEILYSVDQTPLSMDRASHCSIWVTYDNVPADDR